ncbi:MAG TPA: OB-fold nucleic acid binding domain-containing protein, partial [Thermomicrobiales bacterium]|nr:OB-fold nucleic acid binding domain-containing protein [Thermomicrobiales bacterium]
LYMSDHPLNAVLGGAAPGPVNGFAQIVDLADRPSGQMARLIAMIVSVRRIATKTNRTMAIVELEDLTGTIELVAFPDCYERHAALWNDDAILEVTGKIDHRGEAVQLICEQAKTELSVRAAAPAPRGAVHIRLGASADVWADIRAMHDVDAVLRRFEGDDAVVLHVPLGAGGERVLRSRSRRVEASAALARDLQALAGVIEARVAPPRAAAS